MLVSKYLLGTLTIGVLLLLAPAFFTQKYLLAQGEDGGITGNVVNSIYLTISDHRYRHGDIYDQITGSMVNNSTLEIGSASIYAALYNADNQLITMNSGSVTVSTLPAGDNSAFDITLFGLDDKNVDHYTLFPSGTP